MGASLDVDLKPLRQGDLDGLCGVYAILNALQWLLPRARNPDYLTALFDDIIGAIYTIDNIKDGGEEPELTNVFQFIKERVADDFGAVMEMSVLAGAEGKFEQPDRAIAAAFAEARSGVLILGFEGLDSHWTVVRGMTTTEVILFDSWEYRTFDRGTLVWSRLAKDVSSSKEVVVSSADLNWISVRA